MDRIDHVYSIYIKATPERVWRAITNGDDTVGYYYGTRVASDWTAGVAVEYAYPDGSIAADGEVLEIDPGRAVVMSFLPRWSPEIEAEGPVRMVWLVEPTDDGGPRLTVTSALIPGLGDRARVLGRRRLYRLRAQDVPRDRTVARGRRRLTITLAGSGGRRRAPADSTRDLHRVQTGPHADRHHGGPSRAARARSRASLRANSSRPTAPSPSSTSTSSPTCSGRTGRSPTTVPGRWRDARRLGWPTPSWRTVWPSSSRRVRSTRRGPCVARSRPGCSVDPRYVTLRVSFEEALRRAQGDRPGLARSRDARRYFVGRALARDGAATDHPRHRADDRDVRRRCDRRSRSWGGVRPHPATPNAAYAPLRHRTRSSHVDGRTTRADTQRQQSPQPGRPVEPDAIPTDGPRTSPHSSGPVRAGRVDRIAPARAGRRAAAR